MEVINKLKMLLMLLSLGILWINWKTEIYAVEGSVVFGSENYVWYTEDTCPIGVYIESQIPIASYEICLEYDPEKLEYLNGAAEVIENKIYIRGSGTEMRYKNMLHFKPLSAGVTSIQVVSAQGTTVGEVSSGNASENIDMAVLSTAPVTIQQFISNEILNIQTSPAALTDFGPDVKEYNLTVDAQTAELHVEYTAADENASVSISDTELHTGENMITLTVQGTDGSNVYTIYVYREETEEDESVLPEPEAGGKPPVQTEATKPPETQPVMESSQAVEVAETENSSEAKKTYFWKDMDVSLVIASIVCILLLLQYCAMKIQKVLEHRGPEDMEDGEGWQDETLQLINLEKTVIEVEHVTMQFRQAHNEVSSLKEFIINILKRQNKYRMLTALDDISFEVKQGDVVGIIGTNGSGKSTLLKIISGVLLPTSGTVKADKSKVQMLTLGTGFDMELTAKENVYLNGAIIGYSREYIEEKYDEIVKFAELDGFMDERMKNFSTGMVTRLGFAIATMQDTPEILILDEVLSVGDMFFKQKSEKRIKEMIHSGATVLMVSHGVDTILKNCNKVVWIEKGIMKMSGDPMEVCNAYKAFMK